MTIFAKTINSKELKNARSLRLFLQDKLTKQQPLKLSIC